MIDEEITYSRVHHLQMVIRTKAGSDEKDVWPTRKRILNIDAWQGGMALKPECSVATEDESD